MKRTIMLLLTLMLLFSASCAEAEKEIVPEFMPSGDDDPYFSGATFNMGMVADYFMDEDSYLGFISNTGLADLARKRVADVSEKYGVNVTFDVVTRAADEAYTAVAASSPRFDVIQEESYYCTGYIRLGVFANYLDYPEAINCLDTEKWGGKYIIEDVAWNGGIYGILPMKYPILPLNSVSGLIVVNEEFITDLGQTDPREIYENKQWTWSTFDSLLPLYYHVSPMSGEPVYALMTTTAWLVRNFIHTNTPELIYRDDAGDYQLDIYSEHGQDAFLKTWDYIYGDRSDYIKFNVANHQRMGEYFSEGTAVMANIDSYQLMSASDSIAYKLKDFAVLPFPTGPALEPGTIVSTYESIDYMLFIPVSARTPDMSATIINAIYEPLEGYETDGQIAEYLKQYYFTDERDAEMFIEISRVMQNSYYADHVFEAINQMTGGKTALQTLIESRETSYINLWDDTVPRRTTVDALFPD